LSTPDSEGDIEEQTSGSEQIDEEDEPPIVSGVIDRSPESARLIIFGSNSFLADQVLRLIGSAEGVIYNNTTQLVTNIVDWTLEDQTLLSIRSRAHFNRTLPPMEDAEQLVLEVLNYGLAVLGVGLVFMIYRRRLSRLRSRYLSWMQGEGA
jgi:ABC-2 type transport system permease protein